MTTNNLTEQWKRGKLEQGLYYVKNEFGNIFISEYSKDYDFIGERVISGFFTEVTEITEIICEVPSYKEWQSLNELLDSMRDTNKVLAHKLNNIKVNGNYPDKISKLKSRIKGLMEKNEKLEELLKDSRFMLREMANVNNWFEGDDCEPNYYMATECEKYADKIDEVLK